MNASSATSSSATPTADSRWSLQGEPVAKAFHLTLRAKGAVALFVLVVYASIVAIYVLHERGRLLNIVQQMEQVHERHQLLARVNTSLTHSILSLQAILTSDIAQAPLSEIMHDLVAFVPTLQELQLTYPETEPVISRLQGNIESFAREETLNSAHSLRYNEQKLASQLEFLESDVARSDDRLFEEYRDRNRTVTTIALILTVLGWIVLGVGTTLFFARLASDIKKVGRRAQAVVDGYRGPPIEVTRYDELGEVMEAINHVQSDLRAQEHKQEVSRLRRFHQEKMAAVGSIAAAVAHEVNNPINSISGIAQYTIDAIKSKEGLNEDTVARNAELILRQAERIGSIVRHIADLSAPQSLTPELLDVNELVRTTCNLIRYDKRFRHVDLILEPDRELPAVRAVADHLTQVLMNLLINAADALEEPGERKPTIRVSTNKDDDEVVLAVTDNGQGMDAAVLAHAFEQSFSTKPAGKGRGIGLYLCKTLIEEIGGVIELESAPGVGTEARIRLPRRHAVTATD